MPITAWKCAGCHGREVPLDHFATTACGLSVVHPSFAAAVLHHDRAHYARGSGVVEVSNGLGCPREAGIMAQENVAVDPLSHNAALGGTAWHGMMEGTPIPGYQIEYVVKGALGMVPLQGKIDLLNRERSLIEDWKTKTDYKAAGIEKDGAEPNDIAQLSIYAALVEQQDGWRPTRATVWYRFHARGLIPKAVKLMTPGEVLAYKPTKNPTWTVLDLFRAVDSIYRGILRWQDAPMVGEQMSYGAKSKCDYCSVRDVCWIQKRGAAF